MKLSTLALHILVIVNLTGCEYITPVGAGVSAVASVITATHAVKSADAKYTVIGPDCLFYEDKKLDEQSKAGMTREDKEWLARNKCNYFKNCPGKVVPEACQ